MSAFEAQRVTISTLEIPAKLRYGYTIELEWSGKETRQHVVRQYGEWCGSFATRGRAEHEIEIIRGGELPGKTGASLTM